MSNGMSFAYFSSLPRLFVTFPSYAAREPHLIAISLFYHINRSVICSTHFSFVRSTTCIFSLCLYGILRVDSIFHVDSFSLRAYIIFYVDGFTSKGCGLRILHTDFFLRGLLRGIGISRQFYQACNSFLATIVDHYRPNLCLCTRQRLTCLL